MLLLQTFSLIYPVKNFPTGNYSMRLFYEKSPYVARPLTILPLVLIIMCGFLLRAQNIGNHDLSFDEAASVHQIQKSSSFLSLYYFRPSEPFHKKEFDRINALPSNFRTIDPQPPFYLILLRSWISLLGNSETAVRALSLLAGVLAILLIYLTGKTLVNTQTGLWASALLAVSPLHIWHSQDARPYTIAVLLVLSAFYSFCRAQKDNSYKFWGLFVLLMTLALYTNYFSILLLPAGWIFILLQKNKALLMKWSIINIILGILFIPWLPTLYKQISFVSGPSWWIPSPNAQSLTMTLQHFNLGYTTDTPLIIFLRMAELHLKDWKEITQIIITNASFLLFISAVLLGIFRIRKESALILRLFLGLVLPLYAQPKVI